mgnify:CR=1 FL=1
MMVYQACCQEHAQSDSRFRCCPSCGTAFLRCPTCRHLISPLGSCLACLQLVLEAPEGLILQADEELDLPLTILNHGAAPVSLRSLTCRSGSNTVRVDLGGRGLGPGQREQVSACIHFPRAGHFGLEISIELEWRHAGLLGFSAQIPGAVTVKARTEGPLISAHSEGTGNLVNVSGGVEKILSEATKRRGPSEASKSLHSLSPQPPALTDGIGNMAGIVSWSTALEFPDMLTGGADLTIQPRPWAGIIVGRDRPEPTRASTPEAVGTDASLRFPSETPDFRNLSRAISRRHWSFLPWAGVWHIEQLGSTPTALIPANGPRRTLHRGDRASLDCGDRIYALGNAPRRLGFELHHSRVERGLVLRSALRRC